MQEGSGEKGDKEMQGRGRRKESKEIQEGSGKKCVRECKEIQRVGEEEEDEKGQKLTRKLK